METHKNIPDSQPFVSIGVPVYNGRATLEAVFDSLLAQSFTNFELIISDNCSTDGTAELCEKYLMMDDRIRYFPQKTNIGAAANFKFVLEHARGTYFLWAAGDDLRTSDFLATNVAFLEKNPTYVASTSPNCFDGQEPVGGNLITFSVAADSPQERFEQFFKNCWKSHGIFYSVARTAVLRECKLIGQSFIAADWAVDLFLASHGSIHRSDEGLTRFGLNGISSKPGSYRAFRNHPIELFLPFYRLSLEVFEMSKKFPLSAKWNMFKILFKLNMHACWSQAYSALYQFYCRHIKYRISSINQK